MDANLPVLLMPLRIETRFIQEALYIRVFPDEIFMQNHFYRQLSKEERADAKAFKTLSSISDKKNAWHKLVAKHGAYRAGWIVHVPEEDLADQQVMMWPGEKDFTFKWLPKKLYFYIYRRVNGQLELFKENGNVPSGEDIPKQLPVLGTGDDWLQDFTIAKSVGMAIKIAFDNANDYKHIERIVVTGIQQKNQQETDLAKLLANHQYSSGLSFLDYGTSTNNFLQERSAYSINDQFEAEKSFDYAVLPRPTSREANWAKLTRLLGLRSSQLQFTKNADQVESIVHTNYKKATWFALGGDTLNMLFGDQIDRDTQRSLWDHYAKYVKAKGPLASIKIDNQPYGILPVMSLREQSLSTDDPFLSKLYPVLRSLYDKWLTMVDENIPHMVPTTTSDSYEDLINILNMQEYSTQYQLRVRKYDRLSTRVPGWLQQLKEVPTPLPTLPPAQVYDLLNDRPEVENYIVPTNKNLDKLEFLSGLIPDQDRLRYAHLLTFKDDLKSEEAIYKIDEDVDKEDLTNHKTRTLHLNLTQSNLDALKAVLEQIKIPPGQGGGKRRKKALNYDTQAELSLFVDLFLRGYANAAKLYYRVVYFRPTNSQLNNFKSFKLKSPGGKQSNGFILTDNQGHNEFIEAPFPGVIGSSEWFVEEGDEIRAGQKLYLIKDEQNLLALNQEFIRLGQQIINQVESLPEKEARKAQMIALREALDLNSYRLDAWITSMATRRLDQIRSEEQFAKGIYLGAYGWVENLHKNETPVVNEGGKWVDSIAENDGGIIHAPTPAQSLVSTVFKNSFLTHQNEEFDGAPNPFSLNLISDRIQKAGQLMEGIRQDQTVEALLGYRLERFLHEAKRDSDIFVLRESFPLEVNIVNRADDNPNVGFKQLSVIDGLKIIEAKNNLPADVDKETVKKGIAQLEDILDGSLDTLFFEAGFQLLRGNLDKSAAALDATMGKIDPPETEGLKTKLPGTGINHKLAIALDRPVTIGRGNAKALAEPVLETWLRKQLGNMDQIGCRVRLYQGADYYEQNGSATPLHVLDVKLDQLNIQFLDLLYLSETPVSDGAGELELRIWKHIKETSNLVLNWENITFQITSGAPADCKPLSEALEWARYTLSFLSKCRYLKSEDLKMSSEEATYDEPALIQIKDRLLELRSNVEIWALDPLSHLEQLAQFDFQQNKQAYLTSNIPDQDSLQAEINSKLADFDAHLEQFENLAADLSTVYYQAFEHLHRAAQAFFGPAFILLPPALPSQKYADIIAANKQERLVGIPSMDLEMTSGQERIQIWVEELAQVKQSTAAFEEWQMVNSAWNIDKADLGMEYQILQGPSGIIYPWVGLSREEIDELMKKFAYPLSSQDFTHYPSSSESLVLYGSTELAFRQGVTLLPQYGLVIEEFSEHIPDSELNTGLSFHYNGPNAEPPQSLLLAVKNQSASDNSPWTVDDLADILNDTLDLAKVRLIDLEAIEDFGFVLPMTNWFDIPPVN